MNSNNIWKILLLSIFISDLDLHLHALVEADDSVRTLEIISLISILGLYPIKLSKKLYYLRYHSVSVLHGRLERGQRS